MKEFEEWDVVRLKDPDKYGLEKELTGVITSVFNQHKYIVDFGPQTGMVCAHGKYLISVGEKPMKQVNCEKCLELIARTHKAERERDQWAKKYKLENGNKIRRKKSYEAEVNYKLTVFNIFLVAAIVTIGIFSYFYGIIG